MHVAPSLFPLSCWSWSNNVLREVHLASTRQLLFPSLTYPFLAQANSTGAQHIHSHASFSLYLYTLIVLTAVTFLLQVGSHPGVSPTSALCCPASTFRGDHHPTEQYQVHSTATATLEKTFHACCAIHTPVHLNPRRSTVRELARAPELDPRETRLVLLLGTAHASNQSWQHRTRTELASTPCIMPQNHL